MKLGPPNTKGPQEILNFPSPLLRRHEKIFYPAPFSKHLAK